MNRTTLISLKTLAWLACLAPLAGRVWGVVTNNLGADQTHTIAFATGRTALRLLAISLAITPLRRLWPRLSWLVKFRRLIGLFAFFYATLHLLCWAALYANLDPAAMAADVVKRRYVTAGMLAWVLLVLLAATSTQWAIRKLGGRRWNRLHSLVYVAVVAGIVHYWWQVKPGVRTPLAMTVVVAVLLVSRPVLAWWQKQKKATAAVAKSG